MIQALLGHLTAGASQRYALDADQRRLASAAVHAIVLPVGIEENAPNTKTARHKGARVPGSAASGT